ncbi:cytochrome P450 [Rickenella mellea]|uniref:Cytochrome P450 n=1 Tax=Rickenella mellea TaxID=50990 RepID=A0A4R5XH95_9AGAM|nr:cytochrome P450 [Rickenella mellea]
MCTVFSIGVESDSPFHPNYDVWPWGTACLLRPICSFPVQSTIANVFRSFLAFIIGLFTLKRLLTAFYDLFLSPLHYIPGPWYAAISELWMTTHIFRGVPFQAVDALFLKYGPIVRIGPNRVAFIDAQAVKTVYGVKFNKGQMYKAFLTNDGDHAMSLLDHTSHAAQKRLFAPHHTQANLVLFQPDIHSYTMEAVKVRLDQIAGSASVDCIMFFKQLTVDLNVYQQFGLRIDAVQKWNLDEEDVICTAITDFPKRVVLRNITGRLFPLVSKLPNRWIKRVCDSDRVLANLVRSCMQDNKSLAAKLPSDDDQTKMNLLTRMLQVRRGPNNERLSDDILISESMGQLIAGSETVSVLMAFMCWELAHQPEIAKKLRVEVDAAMPDRHIIPDIQQLQELPYLTAFIKEGFRIYDPVPALLDRVVPSQTKTPFTLLGYKLPAGTTVATQAYSSHRIPSIFPLPNTFITERWLADKETPAMIAQLMPFGAGTRICAGQNLAQMVLRIVITSIVRRFPVQAGDGTDEETMQIRGGFAIFPKNHKCLLRFLQRDV